MTSQILFGVKVVAAATLMTIHNPHQHCHLQAAALSSRHSFSPDLSMGNLLKLIDQQTMKMCDKVCNKVISRTFSWSQ